MPRRAEGEIPADQNATSPDGMLFVLFPLVSYTHLFVRTLILVHVPKDIALGS